MNSSPVLRLMPLGGLGEVGMNCLMLECGNDIVVVDCGLMFPEQDVGVDVVHPLFDHLVEHKSRVRGLVLTHGHEDHIGSVPYLLQQMAVPVFGTDLTLRLVQERLSEFDLPWVPTFVSTSSGGRFDLGGMVLETIRVNHSIPQATSVVLRTLAGTVVHTSDFKVGESSDPDFFDRSAFQRLGDEGVALLLSDSTNIENSGLTGGEANVNASVKRIVEKAPAAVFVTLFPSNVRRMSAFIDVARETGRKVILVGRSIERYARAATALGIITLEDDVVVPAYEARRMEASSLMYLVAGTQGEPRSAMTKIARDEHSLVKAHEGDVIIFSSRRIPGNEMRIGRVIDDLARSGTLIHHIDNSSGVHVSGHGNAGDLELMLRLVRPRSFVPVHGNYHFLAQHAALARAIGVQDVLIAEDGEVVELGRTGLSRAGRFPSGRVHVDGSLDLSERILGERRQLADSGIVTAMISVDSATGCLIGEPLVRCHGVFDSDLMPEVSVGARDVLVSAIDTIASPQTALGLVEVVRRDGRRALKRFFARNMDRHPVIEIIVAEVDRSGGHALAMED